MPYEATYGAAEGLVSELKPLKISEDTGTQPMRIDNLRREIGKDFS